MEILKDTVLWRQLCEFGYVVFPFLDTRQVNELLEGFKETESAHAFKDKYHHSTFHTANKQLAAHVYRVITAAVKPGLDTIANDYKLFAANFMIKESSAQSEVVPHQDWTYVDETRFNSFNIWIPLQDVDTQNGCLTFLPKSHKIHYSHRPSPQYPGTFDVVMKQVYTKMIPIEMKAGEAVIFNHATLHGSVPNTSGKKRVNIVLGMYNANAHLIHLKQSPEEQVIKEYDMENVGFQEIANQLYFETHLPQKTYQAIYKQLTPEEFEKLYPL